MRKETGKTANRKQTGACAYCGAKTAYPALLNHTFGSGATLVIITDVETMLCDNRGQQYFKGPVLRMLDAVLGNPRAYITKKLVNVASLTAI